MTLKNVISSSDLSPCGLIGRAAETAAIRRAVSQSRLVTVTGLPGVGKTAAAIAAAAARRFPDGAWLIELDALQDEALLPHTIAAALALPDDFGASPLEALLSELRDKRLLLLLDTCEHMVGACASIVMALRESCPGVRVLATSREPLRVPGEETIGVMPLSLTDAVQLFGRLAAAAGVTATLHTPVRDACAELDGLPLVIGMAARQLADTSLDALLADLENGYDFLSDPDTPVHRHRTLREAIGWSHQLCTPAERLLWARLAVFDRPFCIKDCQEACATTHLPDDAVAVGVTMLAERSILLREPARFVMPATIRSYGLAMLSRLAEDPAWH